MTVRDMARQCLAVQGVDDTQYFTLLDKLAQALASPMFDVSRRLALLAA